MGFFLIVSEKSWHQDFVEKLSCQFPVHTFALINKKEDFTIERIKNISPQKIFIPHWSYLIDTSIYESFDCVVFHMTDLPYGRGGSPLQNLVIRGFSETKISALKVIGELDAGPVYMKQALSLFGTAQEIFLRAADVILTMIAHIIKYNPNPVEQSGDVVLFKRRKPHESEMKEFESISKLYDFIRMLDADGYPNAYIEMGEYKIEFFRASIQSDKEILADVRIFKK